MSISFSNVKDIDIDSKVMVATHQPLCVEGQAEVTAMTLDEYTIKGITDEAGRKTLITADDGAAHIFTIQLSATLSISDWFLIMDFQPKEVAGYSMDYYRYTLSLLRTGPAIRPTVIGWPQLGYGEGHASCAGSLGGTLGTRDWYYPVVE